MRRRDQGRLFGRDETAQHGSARLHQLGRHHDINVAGRRHQREDRLGARSDRRHFDIVDRRASPLRDARHRGGLRGPTLSLSERDDPIGENASALSAHRENGDRDSLRATRCSFGRMRRRSSATARECDPSCVAPPLEPADDRSAGPVDEPIPGRGIVDDLGAIERRTERSRLSNLPAIAATDAILIDKGHRIVFQRIVGMFE